LAGLRSLIEPGEAVSLWAISVDSAADSRAFAASIAADGRGEVAFRLLSDPDHRVIDAYGLADPRYAKLAYFGISYPAAYVVDRTGRITWARIDRDYTQRPPNREIRAAIDALKR
jgi:peroxiredoxin